MRKLICILTVACALWAASPLSVQPAEATAIDTWLRSAYPTTNYGANSLQYFIQTGSNIVLKWDVSSIPATATVTSATMSLWSDTANSGRIVSAYPIAAANSDWTEAGATWNTKDGTNAWAGGATGCGTSGTDYEASAAASWSLPGAANTETQSAVTTSVVQSWVTDSSNNTGLVLIGGASAAAWQGSNASTAGYRPKLVVEYTEGGGTPRKRVIVIQ